MKELTAISAFVILCVLLEQAHARKRAESCVLRGCASHTPEVEAATKGDRYTSRALYASRQGILLLHLIRAHASVQAPSSVFFLVVGGDVLDAMNRAPLKTNDVGQEDGPLISYKTMAHAHMIH